MARRMVSSIVCSVSLGRPKMKKPIVCRPACLAFERRAHLLDGLALLDVVQDALVAALHAEADALAAGLLHELQQLQVGVAGAMP